MSEADQPQTVSLAPNPVAETSLSVPAGGAAVIPFDRRNQSPNPAKFTLEVEGLPDPRWWSPDEKRFPAGGAGRLTLKLTPPPEAAPGQRRFEVRIVSSAYPDDAEIVPLFLDVEPRLVTAEGPAHQPPPEVPREVPPKVPPELPREVPPERSPELPSDTPQPGVGGNVPAPVASGADSAAGEGTATPTWQPPSPSSGTAQSVSDPPDSRPAVAPRKPGPPPSASDSPSQVIPGAATVPAGAPAGPPLPADDKRTADRRDRRPREAVADRSLLVPDRGALPPLYPGDRWLLRFRVPNDSSEPLPFSLDIVAPTFDATWITLVTDQASVPEHSASELTLRLSPPPTAPPGNYSFTAVVGPTHGERQRRRLSFVLLPKRAVTLSAARQKVTVGPWKTSIPFDLTVISAGTAETAFRIYVEDPKAADPAETGGDGRPAYEAPDGSWQYLFNREIEDLRSPASNQPPRPETVQLNLVRKGSWWMGWREIHRVGVAAIPVTDPENAGETGNRVELTGVRLRIWPCSFALSALVFLTAGSLFWGQPQNLRVANGLAPTRRDGGIVFDSTDYYYVLQDRSQDSSPGNAPVSTTNMDPVPMRAHLRWQVPFLAVKYAGAENSIRTEPGNDSPRLGKSAWCHSVYEETNLPIRPAYGVQRDYWISPRLWWQPKAHCSLNFVVLRTLNNLELHVTGGQLRDERALTDSEQQGLAEDHLNLKGRSVTLSGPWKTGVSIWFKNTYPRSDRHVEVWLVRRPRDPGFHLDGVGEKQVQQILPHQDTRSKPITIRYDASRGNPVGDEQPELLFVTTDAAHQVLRVKLDLQSGGSG